MKGEMTFFEMTGILEIEHDKGADLEYLRECAKRSFLLLPTIVTGDKGKVYSLLRGEIKARRISSEGVPPRESTRRVEAIKAETAPVAAKEKLVEKVKKIKKPAKAHKPVKVKKHKKNRR